MAKKSILFGLIVSLVVIACLLGIADRATQAQSAGQDQSVSAKLDEILGNQRTILENLSNIKEELRIIKIRITQSQ